MGDLTMGQNIFLSGIIDFQSKFIDKRLALDFDNQMESSFFFQSVVPGK